MKIVIAGAGDVGTHLARLLSYENKEITLIDLSAERLQKIANQIDVAVVRGSATSYQGAAGRGSRPGRTCLLPSPNRRR